MNNKLDGPAHDRASRKIFHQARLSSVGLLAPPYGRLAERMLAFLMR